jgi:hypothetical protein
MILLISSIVGANFLLYGRPLLILFHGREISDISQKSFIT